MTEDHVEEVVAMMTGIPVQRIAEKESGKLSRMEDDMADKVIGQPAAVRQVVRAIKRNRAGLKDPNKPVGSFIFLGPTGVGKTQLAKELAKNLFDSEEALIRIDMSEYMEKFAVSRLVGAPPGTSATRKVDSSPKRCAASRTPSCCSTRSKRPTRTSSTCCCKRWMTDN